MGNAPHKLIKDDDMPVDINVKGLRYKPPTKSDQELTGWERLKRVFQLDTFGEITPELGRCKDTIFLTSIIGAGVGGVGRSRVAYLEFFRSNSHLAFETPLKARAKLQDAVLLGFGSGAFRIGWRVGVFSTIYTIGSTCLSAYRGKASVLDPAFGGALAGCLYKLKEGPKLTLAGTMIGGTLGLLGGLVTTTAMSLAGLSYDEVLAYNRQLILDKRREELENMQALRCESASKTTLEVLKLDLLDEKSVSEKSSQFSELVQPHYSISQPVKAKVKD